MVTIQVCDVSDRAVAVLRRRAQAAGTTLERWLRDEIERLAESPTDEELYDQIDRFVSQPNPGTGEAASTTGPPPS